MNPELHERIQKLQLLEENLNANLGQKQQAQIQLMELESASAALQEAKESFSIIGNVMVQRPNKDISKDISDKIERVNLRIAALEKQEKQLKDKAEGLQKAILQKMEKK